MDQKKPLKLLFLLLLLSGLLSLDSAAAPLSRTLALENRGEAAAMKMIDKEIEVKVEGGLFKGRMEIELNDYPGSGANSRHDPKNPGKP